MDQWDFNDFHHPMWSLYWIPSITLCHWLPGIWLSLPQQELSILSFRLHPSLVSCLELQSTSLTVKPSDQHYPLLLEAVFDLFTGAVPEVARSVYHTFDSCMHPV